MTIYLGFDPGRDKCGVAVMNDQHQLFEHQVIEASEAIATVNHLRQRYDISLLIIGNQTTSRQWQQTLLAQLDPPPLAIASVDERNSTLEARDRYWQMYPPRGLQKLIPEGMRIPPRPIDDIVAILLIERYFASLPRA